MGVMRNFPISGRHATCFLCKQEMRRKCSLQLVHEGQKVLPTQVLLVQGFSAPKTLQVTCVPPRMAVTRDVPEGVKDSVRKRKPPKSPKKDASTMV